MAVRLLACLPVCTSFVALGGVALIAIVVTLYDKEADAGAGPQPSEPRPRPPYWVAPVVLVVAVVFLLVLSLFTAG